MRAHISVIQLNANHCAAAQSLLSQTATERNVDIMLLNEPYVTGTDQSSIILDESNKDNTLTKEAAVPDGAIR